MAWPPQPPDIRLAQNAIESPHVVILGAGASVAACPRGDRWGRRLPVMSNLVDVVGLNELLGQFGSEKNLETIYSKLAADPSAAELRASLEVRIAEYFDALELPREVTVYDELILSLRRKDLIATFN